VKFQVILETSSGLRARKLDCKEKEYFKKRLECGRM
jgi:hypothetical protein